MNFVLMDFVFEVFGILCVVSIIVSALLTYKLLYASVKKRRLSGESVKNRRFSGEIVSGLSSMNNAKKAKYMVSLLSIGYILRHILINDSPEHDDAQYAKSYISFLNDKTVKFIRNIRGSRSYE